MHISRYSFICWFFGYKSKLGTNPFAFTHLEFIAYLLITFTIATKSKSKFGAFLYNKSQIDVLINSWIVLYLVMRCGIQLSKHFDIFRGIGISLVTSDLLELELITYPLHNQCTVSSTHHDDASIIAILFGCHFYVSRSCKCISRSLLQQQIGRFPQVDEILAQLMVIHTEESIRSGLTEVLLVVGMPLPLQAQFSGIELITLCWINNDFRIALRFSKLRIRFTAISFRGHFSHNWPSIFPGNWLQMYDTTISTFILKMHEPIFSISSMYPSTLVRSIDIALALSHHCLTLIRTVRTLGTHG